MIADLQRFNEINIRHKCVVYGYIRQIQSILLSDIAYFNIHDLIKQTYTLFHAAVQGWNLLKNQIQSDMNHIMNQVVHT